jgi:2-methylcitrate dehydratase PrpD
MMSEHNFLIQLTNYFYKQEPLPDEVMQRAFYALLDAFSCMLWSSQQRAQLSILGPLVPGTNVPLGSRVPGTNFVLEPSKAAYDCSILISALNNHDRLNIHDHDFYHPSDTVAALISVADYLTKKRQVRGKPVVSLREVLEVLVRAYECYGSLIQQQPGRDLRYYTKVASVAAVTRLMKPHNPTVFQKAVCYVACEQAPLIANQYLSSWDLGLTAQMSVTIAYLAVCDTNAVPIPKQLHFMNNLNCDNFGNSMIMKTLVIPELIELNGNVIKIGSEGHDVGAVVKEKFLKSSKDMIPDRFREKLFLADKNLEKFLDMDIGHVISWLVVE